MADSFSPPSPDDPTVSAPASKPVVDESSHSFTDSEHTVVSEGELLSADNAYSGLRPRDLGKVLVGQTIDSVRLEEFVGGGGMGAVFRGNDLALKRTVAVKVLAPQDATDDDVSRRFEIEAQSAARLDHPNIARIHHVGEANGLQYIVFEFIEGPNLRDLVATRGPQPIHNVVSYALQLSGALVHAWGRQVVHRDIKPSNILVTPGGQAKLVDMGLARMHQVESTESELTATGATLGTFDYIAPEQARDPRNADIRSDIYSLGCTLFFLLTGKPPFPDGTALQKLLRHQGDQPPDIRKQRSDTPRPLARLLGKMLAKRPENRPQDPTQLTTELHQIALAMGIAPPTGSIAAAAPAAGGRLRRHAPWLISTGLLIGTALLLPTLWQPAESVDAKFDPLVTAPADPSPMELIREPAEDRGEDAFDAS